MTRKGLNFAALATAALLLGVSAAAAQTCTSPVADGDLIKPGTLVMSTNPTLPPLQFVDSAGELKGMRIELGVEIAKRLCLVPEYIKIDFDAMVPGLQGGRWDMINTGIFYTEARAQIMYMIPYENQAISISVPNDHQDAVTTLEDLNGKSIGVELGGFEESRTRDIDKALKDAGGQGVEIKTFNSFATAYQALRAGQVDAVTSIDGVAEEYQKRGDFHRALHGLYPSPVSFAFKNKALAEAVKTVLDDLKQDGTYDALFESYGMPPLADGFALKGPDL